jgi:hypothetical protein
MFEKIIYSIIGILTLIVSINFLVIDNDSFIKVFVGVMYLACTFLATLVVISDIKKKNK